MENNNSSFPMKDSSLINMLQFLPLQDLVNCAKVSKYLFLFIINDENRQRILNWKLTAEEESLYQAFILSLIEKVYKD